MRALGEGPLHVLRLSRCLEGLLLPSCPRAASESASTAALSPASPICSRRRGDVSGPDDPSPPRSSVGRGLGLCRTTVSHRGLGLVEPEDQFESRIGFLCWKLPSSSRAEHAASASRQAIASPRTRQRMKAAPATHSCERSISNHQDALSHFRGVLAA